MMYTSCYAVNGKDPRAVAISRGVPLWFKGRVYTKLAPPLFILEEKRSPAEYTRLYQSFVLAKLTPKEVLADLGDEAVLLCWERPDEFCHRHIVAEWLAKGLKITVEELVPPKPGNEQLTLI